ncbi:MAG: ATP-binding protein, partial [Gemmatimonadota bacterium]|nr:ATP-binding protein [Gemmatimonadota bacterium]
LLQVNETGAKQLECAIHYMVGNPLDSIVIPDCASLIPDNIRETFANGSNRFETTFITRSGKQIIAEVQECLIEYEGKKAILGVARNITERKMAEEEKNKLEKMLARAEKMEALGIMAGGVAHDLNNILTGIVSYPDLILLQLDNDDPMVEVIETIKASGKKAADIVQDLLTMARRGVRTTRVVNLNDTVSGYLNSPEFKSLKNKCRDIAFDTCFEPELLNIRGSELHLSKTLMNLVTNATEAMPNSGKVTISTANQYIDRPIKGYDDVQEGDYAVLTVADNGTGMDNKSLQRIFEPFYTKKVPGQGGTGIGMAVVWGTVKDHDGYIDVESREHEGTVFRLYFPVTREVKDRDKAGKTVVLEDCRGNGERILVVDDVEEQRIIASELLTRLGYEVTVVPSGEKAIEHVKTSPADLLVLDMIMEPGIDGLDTYRKILEIQPKQKAIIASGYAETERVRETQRLGAGVYLRKPYTLLSFGEAVKNELARNNPAGHN